MPTIRPKRALQATVAAGALVLLTGCGNVHPGAAASVGNVRISMSDVDALAAGLCVRFQDQQQQQMQQQGQTGEGMSVPMSEVRLNAARTLATNSQFVQYADAKGITIDDSVTAGGMDVAEASLPGIPKNLRARFLTAVKDLFHGSAAQVSIAKAELAKSGKASTGKDGSANMDEAVNKINGTVAKWAKATGRTVQLDPRLSSAGSVSEPTSRLAIALDASARTDAKMSRAELGSLIGGMPANQKCAPDANGQ